jgi:hypothetical protein
MIGGAEKRLMSVKIKKTRIEKGDLYGTGWYEENV